MYTENQRRDETSLEHCIMQATSLFLYDLVPDASSEDTSQNVNKLTLFSSKYIQQDSTS